MKITYYGTAAAEGFPALFCTCDTCRRAKTAGGRNIRTRSQALVDDRLLIDFPADTVYHMQRLGLPMEKIFTCIVTHNHSDHFYPADLEMRGKYMSVPQPGTAFTVHGTQAACRAAGKILTKYRLEEQKAVFVQKVIPFETFTAEGYRITPLPADHDPESDPVLYLIEKGGKTLFYAHDTGMLPDASLAWLEGHRPHIDFVSLDCTGGLLPGGEESGQWMHGHLCLETDRIFMERLGKTGAADENTIVCLNHFSHNGGADYDEMVPAAEKYGYLVSYDGMSVSF